MSDETLEIRIDLVDEDFNKLEKGKAIIVAHGIIGASPIEIVIQRQKKMLKTKLEWKDKRDKRRDGQPLHVATLVEDKNAQNHITKQLEARGMLVEQTDAQKILSLIPKDNMIRQTNVYVQATERWQIEPLKTRAEISQLLREGTIYEPREGWLRKT
jgi:hypothetical protein